MSELLYAMSKTKNTSLGPDNIHIKMIKNMPDRVLAHVLNIMNHFWKQSYFPIQWRQATVVPVPSQINLTQILPIIVLLP